MKDRHSLSGSSRNIRAAVRRVLIIPFLLAPMFAMGAAQQFTNPSEEVPRMSRSVQTDLQKIVILCATEPGSPRFDAAWTAWVRENPDADLDRTVRTVVSHAGTMRSMGSAGMEPTKPKRLPTTAEITRHMQDLAASARRASARTAGR